MNDESVKVFRNMISQVFKLTVYSLKGDLSNLTHTFDEFLDSTLHMIETDKRIQANISKETEVNLTTAFLSKESENLFHTITTGQPPTLLITPNQNIVVEKVNCDSDKNVSLSFSPKDRNVLIMNSAENDSLSADDIHSSDDDLNSDIQSTCQTINESKTPLNETVIVEKILSTPLFVKKPDAVKTVVEVLEKDVEITGQLEEAEETEETEETEEEAVEDAEEAEEAETEEEAVEDAEEAEEAETEEEAVEDAEEAEAEDAVEDEEEAEETEDAVEDEETEEAEEEAEEEEEAMEVIKIGKKNYHVGETSKLVYIYINDEEAGECLGKYEKGKIVPN